MNLEKQIMLLEYLISSQDIFIKLSPILQTKYFDSKIKNSVTFIKEYFEDFKSPPTSEQIRVETGNIINIKTTLTKPEILYAEAQLEQFCRQKAIEHAIMASPALLDEGKYGEIEKLIKDAITVGISRNIGMDYFNDPEARLRLLALNNNAIPTGWTKLDEYLGGGLNRKEMIIFAAPSGVGKSLTMSNLTKNLMKRKMNGVYITLELSEEVVCKRFDSMFTGIKQTEILSNITETTIKIEIQKENYGSLHVKRMPESATNANHIRSYLKEFEIVNGYIPDFLVVDYLDLLCSVQQVSVENTFIRDKFIAEELRSIANDYNLIMITASQLGRSASELSNPDDVGQSNIAGGISKINTTDNLVAIMQTPQMKARGEMFFKMIKTRSSNGVGLSYTLKFNNNTLELENLDMESTTNRLSRSINSFLVDKVEKPAKKEKKLSIDDIPFQV